MIDYKPTLVENLNAILPTYYELFVDNSIETPCITYIEDENTVYTEASNLRYSYITYTVKIWGRNGIDELVPYVNQLDNLMFSLGFKRQSYNELWMDEQVSLIFRYRGISYEYINGGKS